MCDGKEANSDQHQHSKSRSGFHTSPWQQSLRTSAEYGRQTDATQHDAAQRDDRTATLARAQRENTNRDAQIRSDCIQKHPDSLVTYQYINHTHAPRRCSLHVHVHVLYGHVRCLILVTRNNHAAPLLAHSLSRRVLRAKRDDLTPTR